MYCALTHVIVCVRACFARKRQGYMIALCKKEFNDNFPIVNRAQLFSAVSTPSPLPLPNGSMLKNYFFKMITHLLA